MSPFFRSSWGMCLSKYGSKLRNKKAWNPIQERGKSYFQDDSKRKTSIWKPFWREFIQIRAGELRATEIKSPRKKRERGEELVRKKRGKEKGRKKGGREEGSKGRKEERKEESPKPSIPCFGPVRGVICVLCPSPLPPNCTAQSLLCSGMSPVSC